MTKGTWVLLLMTGALLLPAAMLGLVYASDWVLQHPRCRAFRRRAETFQRVHPLAFTGMVAAMGLPGAAYFVATSNWVMIGLFLAQLIGIYLSSTQVESGSWRIEGDHDA